MTVDLYKSPIRPPYIGWVYACLPVDPRIIGFTVRAFRWQLWVEWRR